MQAIGSSSSSAFESRAVRPVEHALESVAELLRVEGEIEALDARCKMSHTLPDWMRNDVVDWIQEVIDEFDLSLLTMWTALRHFDRFISLVSVPRCNIQLIAAVSILMSSKLHDERSPSLRSLAALTDNIYTVPQLRGAELHVLQVLKWRTRVITPFCIYSLYIEAMPILDNMIREDVKTQIEFLIDECYGCSELNKYNASEIAFAACMCALDTFDIDSISWARSLLCKMNLNTAHIVRCRLLIASVGSYEAREVVEAPRVMRSCDARSGVDLTKSVRQNRTLGCSIFAPSM